MNLFNPFPRTQTVNDFILHRGRSAVKEQRNIVYWQQHDKYINEGAKEPSLPFTHIAARKDIDKRVAQVNLDLSASNLQNLSVEFTDETGLTIGRKVSSRELSSRVNMFVVTGESLKSARFS
jgi:hypothetical protein